MTQVYDNTNSGALFKNEKKSTDKHPDYTGSINVLGMEFWISAWIKTSQSGKKYMSLAVTKKEPKGESRPAQAQTADMDDEIPF